MALRTILVIMLAACGGASSENEPQTAKEKQALEATEKDDENTKKWSGWRYKGERNDCFYVVGRACFKTEQQACAKAACKAPKKCDVSGAGPATVTCK